MLIKNLLESRIGLELVEDSSVGHTEDPVDDVDDSISRADVGRDDCRVDSTALYRHGIVTGWTLHNVEVQAHAWRDCLDLLTRTILD